MAGLTAGFRQSTGKHQQQLRMASTWADGEANTPTRGAPELTLPAGEGKPTAEQEGIPAQNENISGFSYGHFLVSWENRVSRKTNLVC